MGSFIAMAPEAEIYSIRRAYGGALSYGIPILVAYDLVGVIGADIVYTWGGPPSHPFDIQAQTITEMVESGIVVVAAAHNFGPDLSTIFQPLSPLAIAVGSGSAGSPAWAGTTDTIADTSGRGPVFETFHIKPDIVAPGVAGLSTTLGGGYDYWGGTSRAGPIATGIATLLIQSWNERNLNPPASVRANRPIEIKARMMNTSRTLVDLNPNSVFTVGAGFVQPLLALNAETIVTVQHYVPVREFRGAPFELRDMASLSFGNVERHNHIMPLRITNRGNAPRTYTLTRTFTTNTNPNNAANITFRTNNVASVGNNNLTVTVPAGGTLQVYAVLSFANNASIRFYEGYVEVREGSAATSPIIARLPWAANLTEISDASIISTAPNVTFGEGFFLINEIVLSATSTFPGNEVFVLVNLRANGTDNLISWDSIEEYINANQTISVMTDNLWFREFFAGEYIEILVHRDFHQHLISRHIISPVRFF